MVSRNLTQEEITRLQAQGCSSTDWQRVKVASGFKTDYIQNVRFSGDIELGIFDYEFILEGGLPRHAGLFNVTLHNCRVGNNVLIQLPDRRKLFYTECQSDRNGRTFVFWKRNFSGCIE